MQSARIEQSSRKTVGLSGAGGLARACGASIVGFLVLSLNACYSPSLTFEQGQLDLKPCTDRSPVDPEYLTTAASTSCDQAGRQVLFPESDSLFVPSLGANQSASIGEEGRFLLANQGTYGVVAAQVNKDGSGLRWWGTKRGLEQFWHAFGRGDPT